MDDVQVALVTNTALVLQVKSSHFINNRQPDRCVPAPPVTFYRKPIECALEA